jgi:zinc-binding alcohol dehydrogenase family protein
MKAIAVIDSRLQDIDLPMPTVSGRDLLVQVAAIAVNPVDHKMRGAPADGAAPRVLGWDAAGVVVAAGPDATLFKPGDAVYYAGSLLRPGANSEFHVVDERIVGRKPSTLDFAQAAALPLTSITAWEALFERLGVSRSGADAGKTILIVGGAGGVGSMAIQLARKLARLTVVATASRPESGAWCRALGAHHVIDHHGDMPAQLKALELAAPDFILCLNDFDHHFAAMAEALAPQGKLCSILGNEQPLALGPLFAKSATLVFELMFTRSTFQTPDMIAQHQLLDTVADLVDEGVLATTLGQSFGAINAANLARAHAALEGRRTIGKIVLSGF